MRQQKKPFIVEIKQTRRLKAAQPKPSIWGKLDLAQHDVAMTEETAPLEEPLVESTGQPGKTLPA